MIKDLPNTTVSKVSKKLVEIREEGGVVALGRVLTLIITTKFSGIEDAVKAANESSREHPCRIIVLAEDDKKSKQESKLDAQIRVGGDAGEKRQDGDGARDRQGGAARGVVGQAARDLLARGAAHGAAPGRPLPGAGPATTWSFTWPRCKTSTPRSMRPRGSTACPPAPASGASRCRSSRR